MPRCAIYARFSTDKQSPHSAEDQVAVCTQHAEREGWDVAGVYSDVALSGTSNRRPGMTAMLADAASGSFDIVLAESLDRISRNQADIATIHQRLEFTDVAIVTLSEGRIGALHIGMKGAMSAIFLADLADKIRRGQRGAVSRGRVPGGKTYGYDVVARLNDRGELDRGLRKVNEEQAAVVRRVYAEYDAGRSPKAIAHDLNREGIPAPAGGEWRASSIAGHRARRLGLLHNPIYAGRYLYNRVRMVRDPESRKRLSRVNAADDQVMVDMPELRIVDEALWQRVQEQAEARSTGPVGAQVRPRHILSGLVLCGSCGGSIVAVGGSRLGCARHREAGTCDVGKTILRDELEARVLSGVTERLLDQSAVSLLVKAYHEEIGQRNAARQQEAAGFDRRIAAADASIERLVAAIAEGGADFREIREALAARRADRDSLIRARNELAAVDVIALNPHIVEEYRRRVRSLARSLERSTAEKDEVKARLREIIESVRITPTNTGWDIEVTSSLGAVVALATERPNPRKGSGRSTVVVAKEGLEPPTPGL